MEEETQIKVDMYDEYIKSTDWLNAGNLPVAIVLTEKLTPSVGNIIFPPTYAPENKNQKTHYPIDRLRDDIEPEKAARKGKEANICRIDSVGSQANRMEACFKRGWPSGFKENRLAGLVPQITITAKEQNPVNLLDAGHRIADAAVRLSNLRKDCDEAIRALMSEANAQPLAKLAPTSLVFGFWDSRETRYKYGRIISSTIEATNVEPLKRSSQFNVSLDAVKAGVKVDAKEKEQVQGESAEEVSIAELNKKPLAKIGLASVPSVNDHGGVRVYGEIVRHTQISLVGLRALAVTKTIETMADSQEQPNTDASAHRQESHTVEPNADTQSEPNVQMEIDETRTLNLRRYLLSLALVAGRCQQDYELRQGCSLVHAPGQTKAEIVYPNGDRKPFDWNLNQAFEYAELATEEFGVGRDRTEPFDVTKGQEAYNEKKSKAKK